LDEYNRPLYGGVFGVLPKAESADMGEPINKEPWGELVPEEEDEEEEEEEEEEEDEEEEPSMPAPADGLQTPSGLATPSGMASVVSTVAGGLETPDFLELRKNAPRPASSADDGPRSLYQVVPERQTSVRGLMGSDRTYDVGAVASGSAIPVLGEERGTKRKANGVDVSIDAAELEGLSEEELKRKYEQHSRGGAGVPGGREDFSDLVARESAKRKKQEKERDQRRGKDKEFKF